MSSSRCESSTVRTTAFGLHLEEWERKAYENEEKEAAALVNMADKISHYINDNLLETNDAVNEDSKEGTGGFSNAMNCFKSYNKQSCVKENSCNGMVKKEYDYTDKPDKRNRNGIYFLPTADTVDLNDRYCDEEHEDHSEQFHSTQSIPVDDNEEKEEDGEMQKEVDDDEDARKPQYIPKKGKYYEHDDRTRDSDQVSEFRREGDLPTEDKRWDHDGYIEELQMPKTREEIIAQYGYDIRAEDGPPTELHMRRRYHSQIHYNENWKGKQFNDRRAKPDAQGYNRYNFNDNHDSQEFLHDRASKNNEDASETGDIPKDISLVSVDDFSALSIKDSPTLEKNSPSMAMNKTELTEYVVQTSTGLRSNSTSTSDLSTSDEIPASSTQNTIVSVKSRIFYNTSNFKHSENQCTPDNIKSNSNQKLEMQSTIYNHEENLPNLKTQFSQNQNKNNSQIIQKFSNNTAIQENSSVPITYAPFSIKNTLDKFSVAQGVPVDSIITNPLPRGRGRSIPTKVSASYNSPLVGCGRGVRLKNKTTAELISASNNRLAHNSFLKTCSMSQDADLPADEDLITNMSGLKIDEDSSQIINGKQQAVVTPRVQDILPKRYSLLRQRSRPDAGLNQSYVPSKNFYTPGYTSQQLYTQPAQTDTNLKHLHLISHINVLDGPYQTSLSAGPYLQQTTNIIQQPSLGLIQPPQPPPAVMQSSDMTQQTPLQSLTFENYPFFIPQSLSTQAFTYVNGLSQAVFPAMQTQIFQPLQNYAPLHGLNQDSVYVPSHVPEQIVSHSSQQEMLYVDAEGHNVTQNPQNYVPIVPPANFVALNKM